MKKLIYILLSLLLTISLIACENTNNSKEVLTLPENIETIKIEVTSAVPFICAPIEVTQDDDKFNDLLLWLDKLEFTPINEEEIIICEGGLEYNFTINDDVKFSYIVSCDNYVKINEELYEVANKIAFPFELDDFPIAELIANNGLIRPVKFSKETNDILNIIEPEIHFVDVTIKDEIADQKLSVYECNNGTWQEISYMNDIESHHYQLAFQFFEDVLNVYLISDSGHIKWAVPFDKFDETKTLMLNIFKTIP